MEEHDGIYGDDYEEAMEKHYRLFGNNYEEAMEKHYGLFGNNYEEAMKEHYDIYGDDPESIDDNIKKEGIKDKKIEKEKRKMYKRLESIIRSYLKKDKDKEDKLKLFYDAKKATLDVENILEENEINFYKIILYGMMLFEREKHTENTTYAISKIIKNYMESIINPYDLIIGKPKIEIRNLYVEVIRKIKEEIDENKNKLNPYNIILLGNLDYISRKLNNWIENLNT